MKGRQFIVVIFVIITLLAVFFWASYKGRFESGLAYRQKAHTSSVTAVLNSYQNVADLFFQETISRTEIAALLFEANQSDMLTSNRLRGELHNRLKQTFARLQEKGITGLQFLLADGSSFIRFHHPELYGDDISSVRPAVASVLAGGEPQVVFVNGRTGPGFRYALPIMLDGRLVGAVDFKYPAISAAKALDKRGADAGVTAQIIINRKLLEQSWRHYSSTAPIPGDNRQKGVASNLAVATVAGAFGKIERQVLNDNTLQATMRKGQALIDWRCLDLLQCVSVSMRPFSDNRQQPAGYFIAYQRLDELDHLRFWYISAFILSTGLILLAGFALQLWTRTREQLATISENIAEGMYVIDINGKIIYVNHNACSTLGYQKGDLLGHEAHQLLYSSSSDQDGGEQDCPIMRMMHKGKVFRSNEEQFIHQDGRHLKVSVVSTPLQNAGLTNGAMVIFHDISQEQQDRYRLKRSDIAFSNLAEAVMVTDARGTIQAVNRAFTMITGYTEEQALGKNPRMLQSGFHDKAFYEKMWKDIHESGSWEGEIWNRRRNGEIYPEFLHIAAVTAEGNEVSGYVATFSDITEKRKQEERLRDLAYRDQLTGLHNRTSFMEMFEHAVVQAQRRKSQLALLYIDLDRFKKINDTMGHLVGDDLLREVANRLRESLREDDVVARLGGDEFIVMLEEVQQLEGPARVARKILTLLGQPVETSSRTLLITASVGIAVYPNDGKDTIQLLKNADTSMYMAKREGRNCYHYFTPDMAAKEEDRFRLEIDLNEAAMEDQFVLHYQPKINTESGQIVALEALLRWQHPQRGLLGPDEFLGMAYNAGVMRDITHWVIVEACRQMQEWLDQGLSPGKVSINIDAHTINSDDAYDQIGRTVEVSGVSPHLVELEITEGGLLNSRVDEELWGLLIDMGFELAIDDFGVGESSLLRLKQLPVNTLKIDKSFIGGIDKESNNQVIVRTIVGMGKTLGLKVLAEGVENQRQLLFLQDIGCDEVQGFLFAKPVPAADVAELLKYNTFPEIVSVRDNLRQIK